MEMSVPILLISVLLFFILFFGIGFLLNMLLRMSWVMAIIYPLVTVFIVDQVRAVDYVMDPANSIIQLTGRFTSLALADVIILSSGFIGALTAGIVIRLLRARGYQMF